MSNKYLITRLLHSCAGEAASSAPCRSAPTPAQAPAQAQAQSPRPRALQQAGAAAAAEARCVQLSAGVTGQSRPDLTGVSLLLAPRALQWQHMQIREQRAK